MKSASLLFLLLAMVPAVRAEPAPERVTVRQLLSAPASYHGHRVIVRGTWRCGFENSSLYDGKDFEHVIWVEDVGQDIAKPENKRLGMLQHLIRMQFREREASPLIEMGPIEVEMEGVFFDWPSTPEGKAQLAKLLREGRGEYGGYGHLSGCQQMLQVDRVHSFRTTIESPPSDSPEKSEAKSGSRR